MTNFQSIMAAAAPALDTAFGEVILISPMADSDYMTGADLVRLPATVVGILDTTAKSVRQKGRGSASAAQLDRLEDACAVDFPVTAFPSVDAWPRAGDRLTFLERPELPVFEVIAPKPSGQGRIEFMLARVTR